MSAVRDFESRSRSDTAATAGPQAPSPIVPPSRGSRDVNRRASTFSRASHLSPTSPTDGGLRFRHRSRTNTVTTYHDPDQFEPTSQPGAEPGIDTSAEDQELPAEVSSLKARCDINIIDYSADAAVQPRHLLAHNDNLDKILQEPRPDEFSCRWICVNGLSWDVIKCLGNTYHLHRLSIEDMVRPHSRTKVDWYADHACVILTLQKLVRLHQHEGQDGKCDCLDPVDEEMYEKAVHHPQRRWWQRKPKPKKRTSHLPYHLDTDDDGKIDEFVNAHSGMTADTPIKPVRTLHRYESSQIPEHTAFMEKNSTLAPEDLAVSVEQVSIFLLGNNTVISFFEQSAEDVELPIQKRIKSTETMLRRSADASLLLQAIIDAIVDLAVPVREAYNKARKELQVDAMVNPNIATSRALHIFGEEIDMLQNLIKPIVHLVNAIRDHNSDGPIGTSVATSPPGTISAPSDDDPTSHRQDRVPGDHEGAPKFHRKLTDHKRTAALKRAQTATSVSITPLAHTYFGDVLDHCITMIQGLEQMDASASNISTLIFNTVSARTNNFMMILAIVTVFFAPLTFISGYFGQNFASGAGLNHPFVFFWIVSIPVLAAFMGLIFATMLWDNIQDWFSKRGIRAHRSKRNKMRRAKGYYA